MYLRRLDIQGFKTFAGHTLFEFQPGVTAVVGPNGSGKSNLVDAVRWALGEQSAGALRCKRTEDLIFSGGGRRAPAGFAEVSLTIDNSDRLLPLPYGEVTITRRATRSGDNEYFINRNRVRLRDVQEAIAPISGAYTIINQGLVDAALNLRPRERRRLFEDAAEISVFEQRRADAERRLRETSANVARCTDILAELEPRLRSLKRQAALARSHRDLTAELHGLLERHYASLWLTAHAERVAAEQEAQRLAGVLAARQAEALAASAELQQVRDDLRTLRERLGALHAESSALHARAELAQRHLAVGNEKLSSIARRVEDQERLLRELERQRADQQAEQELVAGHLAEAERRLTGARNELAALETRRSERAAERRAARQAFDVARRSEIEAVTALEEQQRQLRLAAEQREELSREQIVARQALDMANDTLVTRRAEDDQTAAHVATCECAVADAVALVDLRHGEVDRMRQQRATAAEALDAARRAHADLEAQAETLNRLHRSYAGVFAGVRAAMRWAEARQRTGFALVAALLRVPAELETAIEVALGSRLQNIVVDRWEDAEDAIEALKHSGEGRATFLPLDTIRRRGADNIHARNVTAPADDAAPGAGDEVVGVAADLVACDERYRPVAEFLLGRTLVVRDMRIARRELQRLAGGWTIVTLTGEQVNSGGAVTGGSPTKESGTLRRERELREMPGRLASAAQTVEQAQEAHLAAVAACSAAEGRLHDAGQEQRQASRALDQARAAAAQARRAVQDAEADLALHQRRVTRVEDDLSTLQDRAQMLTAEQEALERRVAEVRATVERLRAEEELQSAADAAAEEALATLRASQADAEGEVRASRALLNAGAQTLARLDDQLAAAAQRIAEYGRERAALIAELAQSDAEHHALLAQIDELRERIGPAEAALAELERRREELESYEDRLTAALIDTEATYNRAAVEAQRARDRLDTLWERAAGDAIDIDAVVRARSDTPPTGVPDAAGTDSATDATLTGDLHTRILELKGRISRLGIINPLALEEHDEAAARYDFLTGQIHDLRSASATLDELITELDSAIQTRFETTFHAVAAEFERSFTRLFGGGEARLLLTRDDGEEGDGNGGSERHTIAALGVDIIARPPGKRLQHLALLSGGERALTAAALLFAILKVNPSPFCVLDEVDAALDETNVGRFREALAELTAQTQFLVVTHNRGTIEIADAIYGVTMGDDGASRVLSLKLEEVGR